MSTKQREYEMSKMIFVIIIIGFISGCSSSSTEEEIKNEKTTDVGGVSGFTTDSNTGAVIPDVSISIESINVLSGSDGSYALSNIPIGDNRINASKSGYAPHSENVAVTESTITTHDIVLQTQVCANGLVGLWSGNGNADDSYGINNGQEKNGATYAFGLTDNAFSFDGVDDFVTISDSDVLNPGSFVSVSAWVKINTSTRHQAIVSKFYGNYFAGQNDDSYLLMVMPNDGGLYWHIMTTGGGGILITNPVNISDNAFHNIVGTYDGSLMRVYLDGQEIVSFSQNPGAVTGDVINSIGTPLLIGGGSNGNLGDWFSNGLIDEVTIYNVTLSDTQILERYNAGATGICN